MLLLHLRRRGQARVDRVGQLVGVLLGRVEHQTGADYVAVEAALAVYEHSHDSFGPL